MPSIVESLDALLVELFAGWNATTTALVAGIAAFLAYNIYLGLEDPDIHPMLLLRSSTAAGIRHPGESAVYRSPHVPHGYPLQSSISVPGEHRYQRRHGDLRDVWRRVIGQLADEDGGKRRSPGTLLTVLGKEEVVEHTWDDITKEINVIGKYLQEHGAKRVAIYLPNSVEFIVAVFAAAFYGFSPVLIPYNQSHDVVNSLLRKSGADVLVAAAGSIPLVDVAKGVPSLKQAIWVVEKTSRHVDWNEVPEGTGGKVEVSTWHELVQDNIGSASAEVPGHVDQGPAADLFFIWQAGVGADGEIIQFTQQNVSAATAALMSALPAGQRFSPSDLFLPADSLTNSYTLCLTLAALFSHASIAINSVAGPGVEMALSLRGVAPTVVSISAETAAKLHHNTTSTITNNVQKFAHYAETRAMTSSGKFPVNSLLTKFNAPTRSSVAATPGKLRLVFIAERSSTDNPPLTSTDLSDLRIYLNSRVIYALTAPRVAGAVAQTNIYDYRREEAEGSRKNKHAHFGAPLNSVEIKLVDKDQWRTTDAKVEGEVVVMGPAVSGLKTTLDPVARIREDGCLEYV
ncbi:hypothetical protein HDK77DRAFT_283641 [Phyllosticta capitalensis]|uniref:AMP-dependent synthetase/ligase domain-containing protein n=1 Tax=Phyllosticta capitalensis TaxID=121624 RepID=A0ABR1YG97_9PEZI